MKSIKKYWKVLAGLAFAGILAALYTWFFIYNKPHPDYENLEAEYQFPSEKLYAEYRENTAVTNSKYTGKMISINGKLDYVENTAHQTILVFVFEQGMFGDEGIRCSLLENYKITASDLEPGTEVRVKGMCTGYNETDVIIEKCTVKII